MNIELPSHRCESMAIPCGGRKARNRSRKIRPTDVLEVVIMQVGNHSCANKFSEEMIDYFEFSIWDISFMPAQHRSWLEVGHVNLYIKTKQASMKQLKYLFSCQPLLPQPPNRNNCPSSVDVRPSACLGDGRAPSKKVSGPSHILSFDASTENSRRIMENINIATIDGWYILIIALFLMISALRSSCWRHTRHSLHKNSMADKEKMTRTPPENRQGGTTFIFATSRIMIDLKLVPFIKTIASPKAISAAEQINHWIIF